jgi:hypothetical protein
LAAQAAPGRNETHVRVVEELKFGAHGSLRGGDLGCFALRLRELEQSRFQHFQAALEKRTQVRFMKADGRVGFWCFA